MDLINIICSSIATKDFIKGLFSVAIIGIAIIAVIAATKEFDPDEPMGCVALATGILIGIGLLAWFFNWLWDWGLIG